MLLNLIESIKWSLFSSYSASQVDIMTSKFHIYLLKNGRINMCALTTSNIDYVAQAIHAAVMEAKL